MITQSYPNASALLKHSKSIYVINTDAHLDVRPLKENNQAHSGSPFRLLCEDQRFYQNPSSKPLPPLRIKRHGLLSRFRESAFF